MKYLIAVSASLLSFNAYALGVLANSPDGTPLYGCHYLVTPDVDKNTRSIEEGVIVRNSPDLSLNGEFSDSFSSGKVLLIRGTGFLAKEKKGEVFSRNSFGIARFDYEGTVKLEDKERENWTAPSPAGTYFTSRGSYLGFFLFPTENAQSTPGARLVDGFFKKTYELNCTASQDQVQAWIKDVKGFSLDW